MLKIRSIEEEDISLTACDDFIYEEKGGVDLVTVYFTKKKVVY